MLRIRQEPDIQVQEFTTSIEPGVSIELIGLHGPGAIHGLVINVAGQ